MSQSAETYSGFNRVTIRIRNWRTCNLNITIGSDHAGFEMRHEIAAMLSEMGHTVVERGAASASEPYSYVKAGLAVVKDISDGTADKGVAICGTGIGISIVCNKKRGIRCALCMNEFMARMARQHNNANILALGARVIGKSLAQSIVGSFLSGEFDGGRHQERLDEIESAED